MKILHILDERWDSGLTAYGLAAARAMKQRGHDVWVAARPGLAAARQTEGFGFPVYPLESTLGLRRWIGQNEFHVVNAHTGAGHSAGFFATRFKPTALVRTRGEARVVKPRPGQSLLFRETDGVVVASKALGDVYDARFPFLMDRLSVIYPGVEVPAYTPPPPGPLRFGLLGRLDPVKGHDYLLQAIQLLAPRLTDQTFLVAGEDKKISKAELERRVAQMELSPWIRFLGRVPDAGAFMDDCHAGIIASVDSEAVSRAALEWMARGRPLVATAVGALPEMVLNGDNGYLVPPKNPGALARTIGLLMDNAERRQKMGERARRLAETQFGLAVMGEKTEKAYDAAVAHRWRSFR
ncbi:MAG: glycosyltransferase family 4 protein [Elusimicrobia bacterium]|nr:glycosyltransferase family 4 protein [Elusimicrobiota bacterium]